MYYCVLCASHQYTHRLHRAVAPFRAVARIHVDMLAPEAFWTVISVAVSLHRSTAVLASEGFDSALEPFGHLSSGML